VTLIVHQMKEKKRNGGNLFVRGRYWGGIPPGIADPLPAKGGLEEESDYYEDVEGRGKEPPRNHPDKMGSSPSGFFKT